MRKYKYEGQWMDFNTLHSTYGFTRYPTITNQGYKSALSSNWGEQISNYGYLDKHDSTNIANWQFYTPTDKAWANINALSSNYNLYPSEGIDTILMNDTRTSKAILYLAYIEENRVELWYLIKNDLSLGWVKDSDLSIHGYSGSTLPLIASYSEVPLTTVINNGSLTTRIPYTSSKLYSYMVIPQGNNTVQYDGWEIGNDNGYLSLTNKTGEDVYVVLILFKEIDKVNLDIVNVRNNTYGDIGDAYRYNMNGTYWYTPVWYDMDWVVDLSDLGFSLLPIVTHKIGYLDPSQTPVVDLPSGAEQPLCDFNCDQLYYDSSISYESVRYYDSSNGSPIHNILVTVGKGHYGVPSYLSIFNNIGVPATIQRVEYVEYEEPSIQVIQVHDSNNILYNALRYRTNDPLFYVLNGIHNRWVNDLSPIGYFLVPSVGDIITFGNYPQTTSTPELIEWMVLDVNTVNKRALVIAKKVLDSVSYNTENANVTWEVCSLRAWLNSTFYNAAFDSTEQDRILLSHIENPDNPNYGTVGGNATDDKVFLLSIQEARNTSYFADNAARKADATQYVIDAGGYASWWLRSPGDSSDHAVYVGSDGTTYFRGIGVIYPEGVRPVMWITYN